MYVTTHRAITFENAAADAVRRMGFPILDAGKMSQSRWESSFDGVRYLRQYSPDNWASHTGNMIAQAMLNVLFQSCAKIEAGDAVFSPTPSPSVIVDVELMSPPPTPSPTPTFVMMQASATPSMSSSIPIPAPVGGSADVDKNCIPVGDPIPSIPDLGPLVPSSASGRFKTSSGRIYTLSINSGLQSCYHTYFTLIPDDAPNLSPLEEDPDVSVTVHLYTNTSAPGQHCQSNGLACARISRQLPLRINADATGLVAIVVPDPASKHYVFTVRVRPSDTFVLYIQIAISSCD